MHKLLHVGVEPTWA